MQVSAKGRKTRKNRRRKDPLQLRRRWMGRLLAGFKVVAIVGGMLLASAGFIYGYAAVTRSDYFRADRISISGNQRVSDDEILDQAGIDAGSNLLALNLSLVRRQLLAHPWIAEAHVRREIPETLIIQVVEHDAMAQIDMGRKFLINTAGRIFKEVKEGDPGGLPLVQGIEYGDISLGEEALNPPMASVVEVLHACREDGSPIGCQAIEMLRLDKEMGITLVLREDHRMIKLGFGNLETKLERFKRLQPVLEGNEKWRAFQVVDLNDPDRVVVRIGAPDPTGA